MYKRQGLVHVGEQAAALVTDAGADHRGPRLDVFRLDDAGDAGGGDQDLGALRVPRPVLDPGVHDGDRGVRGRALLGQQHRERPAERGAATENDHLTAGDLDAVVGEQRLDPGRGAGQRPGQPDGEATHVERVHPVDVLVRVEGLQRRVVVQVGRDRILDQDAVHVPVVVEAGDHLEQVGLRDVATQVLVRGLEAELGGLLLLDPDVPGAGVVVADQDGGEAGLDAAGLQLGDPVADVGQDGLGDGRAGQEAGAGVFAGHVYCSSAGSPGGRLP